MIYKEFRIEKINKNTINDLLFLFQSCFGFRPEYNFLLNKQMSCHGKNLFVGFIAYQNESNEPAAFYGVYPQLVSFKGKDYLLAQSGDTMTHPFHQKKGLFVALASHTYKYCKEIGIKAIFGFPNNNSFPGFVTKLNFSELDSLVGYTFLENRFEYARLFKNKSNKYNRFVYMLMSIFYRKGESFSNSIKNNAFVVHDDLYFKSKNKNRNYFFKIKNTNVFLKLIGNNIIIGDIDLKEDTDLTGIINSLKTFCRVSGKRFLNFDTSTDSSIISKIEYLSKNKAASNKVIFLKLDKSLPFDSVDFMGCDIDVF